MVSLGLAGKRVVARVISECCALGRLFHNHRPGFRVLLYHAIGSNIQHDTYGATVSRDLFEQHMALLAGDKGVSVVSLNEMVTTWSVLQVAVTFDDGYKDTLHKAAPILIGHSMPFTVFVTSSYIQRYSEEYLSTTELKELADLPGVTIGSHGSTHAPLAECDDSTLWQEVHGSRCSLEDMIGKPVTAISYPHGSVDGRVVEAARKAGYTLGACSRFDINGYSRDPLLLCRTEIIASDSGRVFLQKLHGVWDWRRWCSSEVPLFHLI